jgi:transposase
VDFRKGPDGLVGLVRDAGADPFNGSLYVFRAKRADRIKRGGSVCLNSYLGLAKWISALVMLLPGLASAH